MNPIYWIMAHTAGRSLVRDCPRCARQQLVRPSKRLETVACKECGAEIPAPAEGGRTKPR